MTEVSRRVPPGPPNTPKIPFVFQYPRDEVNKSCLRSFEKAANREIPWEGWDSRGRIDLSAAKKRKLVRAEDEAEAKRKEQLKEERGLGKAATKSQTKPRRNRAD
jgi:hypothetical protein